MLFIILVLFDQGTKYLIRILGGFYICNSGISFGFKLPPVLFWLLWATLIVFLLYLYNKSQAESQKIRNIGIIFILSGAISNALDRLFFGCVVDFINLRIWPVFNLADVFITFGAIIIIIATYKLKVK